MTLVLCLLYHQLRSLHIAHLGRLLLVQDKSSVVILHRLTSLLSVLPQNEVACSSVGGIVFLDFWLEQRDVRTKNA